jgi:flagellin
MQTTKDVALTNLQAELLSAVNGALQGLNEKSFDVAGGSDAAANTTANAAGESMMMTAARNAANTVKVKYGNDEVISAAIDELIAQNGAAIKAAFTYTDGSTAAGSDTDAPNLSTAGSWGSFSSATGLANIGSINSGDVNNALNSLGANVTVAAGSDIKANSVLAKDTILAVGSTFTVDKATTITLNVDRGDVAVRMDENNIVWVGDTSLATGSSITLKDGVVLRNNGTGALEITHGSAVLAAKATVVASGTAGINSIASNSVISAGSTLETGSQLATGSVIGAAKNAEVVRGSIEVGAGAVSMTFGGAHTLKAEFNGMEVGLSNTWVFTTFRAGSNDLENSVMGQVGANSGQILFISMNDMRAEALGVDKIDVASRYGAAMGIETVNNALQKVSQQRSVLGAAQNRLEHTIKNLDAAAENLQAAESRIRDVDMAKEIMTNTKNNILQQASQAMLAQANQAPQSVLQLLR